MNYKEKIFLNINTYLCYYFLKFKFLLNGRKKKLKWKKASYIILDYDILMEKPVDKGLTVSKHISRADLKKRLKNIFI